MANLVGAKIERKEDKKFLTGKCRYTSDINLPKQKSNGFKDSIFYKPQTLIKIRKKIQVFITKVFSAKSKAIRERDIYISNKKFFYAKSVKLM